MIDGVTASYDVIAGHPLRYGMNISYSQNTRTCSSPLDLQWFVDYPAVIMDTKEALDVIGPSSTVSVTSCLYIRLMD